MSCLRCSESMRDSDFREIFESQTSNERNEVLELLKLFESKLSENIGISEFLMFWEFGSLSFRFQLFQSQIAKDIEILALV